MPSRASGPRWVSLALLMTGLLWASRAQSGLDCFEGARERLVVELLLGRNIGHRLGVSEQAFRRFLDQEVTPRFPGGFTLLDMHGQFRGNADRKIVREPGKYLLIALEEERQDLARVREIVEAYKSRFRQQSVGVLTRRSCVQF